MPTFELSRECPDPSSYCACEGSEGSGSETITYAKGVDLYMANATYSFSCLNGLRVAKKF